VYRLIPDAPTVEQVAALPDEALLSYAEVLSVLELKPWAGPSQHEANPDGPVRRWTFGPGAAGQVIYLIYEERLEVHLLLVQWLA
jgi:hypothetical protein